MIQSVTTDSGSFHSAIVLHLHTLSFATDTALPIDLRVSGYAPPAIQPVAVKLRDRCTNLDTIITVKNNHCDSITIVSVVIADTSLVNLRNDPALPLSIQLKKAAAIGVRRVRLFLIERLRATG